MGWIRCLDIRLYFSVSQCAIHQWRQRLLHIKQWAKWHKRPSVRRICIPSLLSKCSLTLFLRFLSCWTFYPVKFGQYCRVCVARFEGRLRQPAPYLSGEHLIDVPISIWSVRGLAVCLFCLCKIRQKRKNKKTLLHWLRDDLKENRKLTASQTRYQNVRTLIKETTQFLLFSKSLLLLG